MASKNDNVVAIFKLESKEFEVIECNYGFTQNFDASNKPSGAPAINLISLVIKVTNELDLADWMVNPTAQKKGSIKIQMTKSKFREIKFNKGYCVNYSESFDNYSEASFLVSLSILVKDITLNDGGNKPVICPPR